MSTITPSRPEAPDMTLVRWRTFEAPTGERYVVGYAPQVQRERVTPALVELDARTLCATSSCGRVYRLDGAPDEGSTATYVWTWFAAQSRMQTWRDSTRDVWDAHERAAARPAGSAQP